MKISWRLWFFTFMLASCIAGSRATAQSQNSAKATKTWNPPRTPDGQPDIQGYWGSAPGTGGVGAAQYDIEDGYPPSERLLQSRNGSALPPPKPDVIVGEPNGKLPYQPWAEAVRDENKKHVLSPTKLEQIDSLTRCLQVGVPRQNFLGGFQFIQTPGFVLLVHSNGLTRIIPVDGRPHIPATIKLWSGDSIGHWEGNTLVVDVTNFNEYAWYDVMGNFHSDQLHLVERWKFVDPNTIEWEVTNDDPKVFTKPWKMKDKYVRSKNSDEDAELLENACFEGEHDVNAILSPDNTDHTSK